MIIISPAKKLDFQRLSSSVDYTQSKFINKTDIISQKLKSLRLSEIKSLMSGKFLSEYSESIFFDIYPLSMFVEKRMIFLSFK